MILPVAPLGDENVAYHENNNLHRMNNYEWTDEQRHRIVEIDTEERKSGKYFMRRVKERWDTEFPIVARTAQTQLIVQGDFEKMDGEDLQWRMMRWIQLRYSYQKTKKEDILNGQQK